jgi:hypothetical protein
MDELAEVNAPLDTSTNPRLKGANPTTGSWHSDRGTVGAGPPGADRNGFDQTNPTTTATARMAANPGAQAFLGAGVWRRSSASDGITGLRGVGLAGVAS